MHSAETSVLWEESRKFSANRKGSDRVVQVQGKEELKIRGNTEPVTNILSLHRRPKKGRERDSVLSVVETTKDFLRATGNSGKLYLMGFLQSSPGDSTLDALPCSQNPIRHWPP